MAKKPSPKPLKELPKETRLEIERAKARIATEKVKIGDAKLAIEEHQTTIEKLREG